MFLNMFLVFVKNFRHFEISSYVDNTISWKNYFCWLVASDFVWKYHLEVFANDQQNDLSLYCLLNGYFEGVLNQFVVHFFVWSEKFLTHLLRNFWAKDENPYFFKYLCFLGSVKYYILLFYVVYLQLYSISVSTSNLS